MAYLALGLTILMDFFGRIVYFRINNRGFCDMFRRFFLIICLLAINFVEASLPDLDNSDVHNKIAEILDAHVKYKKLDDVIIRRALTNYVEILDSMKTYFTKSEVEPWLEPSEQMIERIIDEYSERNFTVFEEIHDTMLKAIERRERLERAIDFENLPPSIPAEDFTEEDWSADEEALSVRLEMMKSVMLEAYRRVGGDNEEKFLKRQGKRRRNYHEKIYCDSVEERRKLTLTNIIKSVASSLDIHTMYFTPAEATQFMIDVQRRLFGIGVQLRDNLNGFLILKVIENSPAARSNMLKEQDLIVAVNGEPVIGMSIEEVVELMRGERGTPVNITVIRGDLTDGDKTEKQTLVVDLVRDEVIIKDSRIESSCEPFGDGVLAVVKLYSFYQDPQFSSTEDLISEIEKIKSENNLKGVVLDMRYNTGGLLSQAIAVTGLFISQGVVASVKDNEGEVFHLRDFGQDMLWDGPLIVLTSRASASAPEIVAQSLQDYGRAIIVGDDHTFGKGSFQTFTLDTTASADVNPKGEYKVTRGMYYTVSGRTPQRKGVVADIVVPSIFAKDEIGEGYEDLALEGDTIPDNFHDTMSDLSPTQRERLMNVYGMIIPVNFIVLAI